MVSKVLTGVAVAAVLLGMPTAMRAENITDSDSPRPSANKVAFTGRTFREIRGNKSVVSLALSLHNSEPNAIYVRLDVLEGMGMVIMDGQGGEVTTIPQSGDKATPNSYYIRKGRGLHGAIFVVPVARVEPGEVREIVIPDILRSCEKPLDAGTYQLKLPKLVIHRHVSGLIERQNVAHRFWIPGRIIPALDKEVRDVDPIELNLGS